MCLEGELPDPEKLPGCCGVLLAPGCLVNFVGAMPTGCAPWLLSMDFLGRLPSHQPCLRAVLIHILMEETRWLWAESEGVPGFGVSLAGLGV